MKELVGTIDDSELVQCWLFDKKVISHSTAAIGGLPRVEMQGFVVTQF